MILGLTSFNCNSLTSTSALKFVVKMQSGKTSRTALASARHRAAHQVIEQGCIFSDPLAMRILGEDPEIVVREAEKDQSRRRVRVFVAARTRIAEDALAKAVEDGVRQLVILGAGLDTYAYRSPFGDRLHIFEVDHPATQAWKRQRLAQAAIPLPNWLTFIAVDFEHETLVDCLLSAGFNPEQQTFFTWLELSHISLNQQYGQHLATSQACQTEHT